MAARSAPVLAALNTFKADLMAASTGFADYNFREYFTRHSNDLLKKVEENPSDEALSSWLNTEGKQHLRRMHRMATINSMYAEVPVVVDSFRISAQGSSNQ